MEAIDLAKQTAILATDKKAEKILVLDMQGSSDVCEYMMICSAQSDRQARAISEYIEESLKQRFGLRPLAVEGRQTAHWILLDYGHVLVHVFFDYVRDYYALEKLWSKAKILNLKSPTS